MKIKTLFLLLSIYISSFSQEKTEADYQKMIDSVESTLNYQYGKIDLLDGVAKINVPKGYKFLNAEQSKFVLTDLWGNPPNDVEGLLFPEHITPLSDNFTYAVEISYSEEGYIEDEDAKDIDYDDLLEEMQNDTNNANKERIKQGYEPINLIGWASKPYYDNASKKLHWAKELKFGTDKINTLNYNIRVLGRKGYLNLNAIGQINILPIFKKDINNILASVEFNKGNTYSDFNPDIDDIAAYGIGGLIAGKVLAKVGFFALIAKFWKVIALAVVGAFSVLKKRLLGGKNDE